MASSNMLPQQSPDLQLLMSPSTQLQDTQSTVMPGDKEYEFFVTTEEPHQPEGPERGLIRRLVMRNFFETKWSGPEANNASENNSASTVQAKTRLKSRFRLPKPGLEAGEPKAKAKPRNTERRQSREECDKRERRPGSSRKLSGLSLASEQSDKCGRSCRKRSSTGEESGEDGKRKVKLVLKINPAADRFDPFDVLPIPGTPELDMLFKLYKCGSRANSVAINVRNTWWPFISNDAGLLHATLATWALYAMLVQGAAGWRVQELRHKSEAIKQVNLKIGNPGDQISDELVGTVLTLASFENLLGAYDAAQLHIAALKRMVNARGGLFSFGHNDGLIRGIIWVDFHSATAFRTPPSFSQICLDPDTPPLPDALLEVAAYTSPTSLLQLSCAAIDCFNIFYRLHRLALAISSHWFQRVDRLTISNLLYETEYIVLSVPDRSRDFLDFDLATHDEPSEDYDHRWQMADGASVVEALLAAVQIFIYASLRELPTKVKIFSILLERLRIALDRPNTSMLDVWKREKNVEILLWVIVIACSVAPSWGGRSWWIGRLSEVSDELGIKGELELERALLRVAWTDVFFGDVLNSIWEEVCVFNAMVQSSEVYLSRSRGQSQDSEDTINPQLLEDIPSQRIEYDKGRWRVKGWYI